MDHLLATTDWEIVGIDSFRHKGLTDRIRTSMLFQQYRDRVSIITHDCAVPFSTVLTKDIGRIDAIVNMASDSHVDRSLDNPIGFIKNNIFLATEVLEFARRVHPEIFVQVSTDEVYGPVKDGALHPEWDPILPSNPYSASKACQESIAISYWRSFGVPVVITNAMNMFGEYQDPEKFVPRAVRMIREGLAVPVHATNGEVGTRCWLHARNYADAIRFLIERPVSQYPATARPDRYNVVGERHSNLEIVELLCGILGVPVEYDLVDYHARRTGHDLHYGLDGTKLAQAGWVAPVPFRESLGHTAMWFTSHPAWLEL